MGECDHVSDLFKSQLELASTCVVVVPHRAPTEYGMLTAVGLPVEVPCLASCERL